MTHSVLLFSLSLSLSLSLSHKIFRNIYLVILLFFGQITTIMYFFLIFVCLNKSCNKVTFLTVSHYDENQVLLWHSDALFCYNEE